MSGAPWAEPEAATAPLGACGDPEGPETRRAVVRAAETAPQGRETAPAVSTVDPGVSPEARTAPLEPSEPPPLPGTPRSPQGPAAASAGASPRPYAANRQARIAFADTYLTPRELQVLDLIGQRMTNAEIARQLGLAETTVKSHVRRMLERAGVRRRTDLADLGTRAKVPRAPRPRPRLPLPVALDPAQRRLVALVAQGRTLREIAAELGVSVPKADYRIKALRRRLGAADRAQLVRIAADIEAGSPLIDAARAARPLLLSIPPCPRHPTITPLRTCADCGRWTASRRVVADLDAHLPGGVK